MAFRYRPGGNDAPPCEQGEYILSDRNDLPGALPGVFAGANLFLAEPDLLPRSADFPRIRGSIRNSMGNESMEPVPRWLTHEKFIIKSAGSAYLPRAC